MPDAWTVSDYALYRILRAYLASLAPNTWFTLDLYTNNYTPSPGDDSSKYTIPTQTQWPGYVGQQLPATAWAPVQVTADVATTFQPAPCFFVFPSTIQSFTLYGYLVVDGFGNLQWAEEFATPITTSYPGGLSVQSYFNVGIQNLLTMEEARHRAGFVDDDDDDDEEEE